MPIAGELFGYNFSYDYLDDICGNVGSDDADTLNGITWIDITDPDNPVSMTPGVSLTEANAGLRELTEAQKIALGNLCAQDIINYILGRFDGA